MTSHLMPVMRRLSQLMACATACFTILSSMPLAAADAMPLDSMAAYDHVQAMRHEAGQLADSGRTDDIRKAIAHLEDALAYLDRKDVHELAVGNPFLYARGHDVRMDLAQMYAHLGDKERALSALEGTQQFLWTEFPVRVEIEKDPAFDLLKGDPRFDAYLTRAAIPERLWKHPAVSTPYKAKLSVEERIAGLSIFWAEARQLFVHFEHAASPAWDEEYMQYLPRVMHAESTSDYYRVMMEFAATLRDGHTNVYPPRELMPHFYARPPIRTEKIGSGVYVTGVYSKALSHEVHIGEQVLTIDGVPVVDYAKRNVMPMVSSSTPQDRDVRAYSYFLLAGDAGDPVKLRLEAAGREPREVVLPRSGYRDVQGPARFEFRMLPDDVAYLSLDDFESDAGVKALEAAFPQIEKAKGLVLDVRNNGGGSGNFGLEILSHLTTQPIPVAASRMRDDYAAGRDAFIRWVPWPGSGRPYIHHHTRVYEGPVAVLIGPRTFSAAEDFVLSFELMKRGPIVGSPTSGSTGQPLLFDLPGGGKARICVKDDRYPDGHEFVGKGIMPTIPVSPTVDDLRAGRDRVLDEAAKALLGR